MKNSRIVKFLIMFLFVIEIISIFLTMKSFSNKPIAEIKEINEVDKKQFSMFISDEEGNYTEYIESNLFPEGYTINLENSKCIDTKGNIIDGILSGNGTNITVTSTKTAYCYLYFDEEEIYATQYLIENVSSDVLWDSTLEDDGYRYVGTGPDNYICFGTTDSDTCTSNTDLYMYRIIGIFEDREGIQHLKLIKKEALNTAYVWDESVDYSGWANSGIYTGLNGSYFLTNTTYSYMQDSNWTNKIATWEYTAVNTLTDQCYGLNYYYNTSQVVYLHELNRDGKSNQNCLNFDFDSAEVIETDCSLGEWQLISAKIGLMYASDYLLSLGSSSLNYTSNSNSSTLQTGWMHISNNDSEPPNGDEWTLAFYGAPWWWSDKLSTVSWVVYSYGGLEYKDLGIGYEDEPILDANSTRPVFYLESDIELTGEGSTTNPYIITN